MLRHRLLTGVVLASVILFVLFTANTLQFNILVGTLLFCAGVEWASVVKLSRAGQFFYGAIICATYVGTIMVSLLSQFANAIVIYLVPILWSCAFFMIIYFPRGQNYWGKYRLVLLIIGFFVLLPVGYCTTELFNHIETSPWLVFYVLCLVSAVDTGAFFAGTFFGKRLLCPSVSPKKSVEGLIGGVVFGLIVALVGIYIFSMTNTELYAEHRWVMLAIALVTVLFAIIGDLFESMVKRSQGVKDSSTILPGHGGLLDRLDSLAAAIPIFYLLHSFFILKTLRLGQAL